MGRHPGILGEGITYHVMSRCHNEAFLFRGTLDFALYWRYLCEAKEKFRFDLHAFQFLQNHVHLILKTNGEFFLDTIMHWLNHSFAEHYNKQYCRKGAFWRDRYMAKIIKDDLYGLACLRYVHRNALNAGLVERPDQWPWTCYKFYADGEANPWITPLPSYLGLACDETTRREIYRHFVAVPGTGTENGHLWI